MLKFYDTCALLELQEDAFIDFFYCSDITLHELENIKTASNKDQDVKYRARKLSRLLDENYDMYKVVVWDKSMCKDLSDRNDVKIIECALSLNEDNLVFVTNDICAKNIARGTFGLNVSSVEIRNNQIYKGYKLISGNSKYINEIMENLDLSDFAVNEYLIIEDTDEGTFKEMRFDGEKFVSLKLPPSKYIKGKNSLQRCALDILNNPDITIAAILGGYGSGKTFLCMKMSLYCVQKKDNQSKILGVREVLGEGQEIGFLPGDKEMKVGDFFKPLEQQLDGREFELESLKQQGVLEMNVPYFMKGTTYDDTIILVDEAEDLNHKQIKLIGTRIGENGRIFLAGDYKQSVINTTEHNALIEMCNSFKGNKSFACIYLGEDVRSSTSKMFADLWS